MRSEFMARRFLRGGLAIAVIVCGMFFVVNQAVAGSDHEVLSQNVTLQENGAGSSLFVPQQATVFFDFTVQPGKDVEVMVITEDQYQAVSAGEKASGEPILRTTVSGVDTRSVSLERGTYFVALRPTQGTTQITMRVHARY